MFSISSRYLKHALSLYRDLFPFFSSTIVITGNITVFALVSQPLLKRCIHCHLRHYTNSFVIIDKACISEGSLLFAGVCLSNHPFKSSFCLYLSLCTVSFFLIFSPLFNHSQREKHIMRSMLLIRIFFLLFMQTLCVTVSQFASESKISDLMDASTLIKEFH